MKGCIYVPGRGGTCDYQLIAIDCKNVGLSTIYSQKYQLFRVCMVNLYISLIAKRISIWISHQLFFSYNAPTSAEQRKLWMFVGLASPETQTGNIHDQLPGCYCSIYFAFNHLLIDLTLQLRIYVKFIVDIFYIHMHT